MRPASVFSLLQMDGEPVPEDEPPQEEPQAQAGGQQRTVSPEPQRRDSHARAGPSGAGTCHEG